MHSWPRLRTVLLASLLAIGCTNGDDKTVDSESAACADADGDGVCDADDTCDGDDSLDEDGDGVPNACDTCSGDDTVDGDGDGVPDACDVCDGDDALDADGDAVPDDCDVCPDADDGLDADGDGVPDDCDACEGFDDAVDVDEDGTADGCDACVGDDSVDSDSDGVPDDCDACEGEDDRLDADGDGVPDGCDLCADGDDTIDTDLDGVADDCDACPLDLADDSDGDGVCDSDDSCEGEDDTLDADLDGTPDGCDPCPADATGDTDGDGVCDGVDACEGEDDALDADEDTVPDGFDVCEDADDLDDGDGDGVPDLCDLCEGDDDAEDADGDTIPDACDVCAGDDTIDSDADGVPDSCDGCPLDAAKDLPGICGCGAADTDGDGDGVTDCVDACPLGPNDDSDGDGVFDACDLCEGSPDDGPDADGDDVPDACDACVGDDTVDTDGDGVADDCDDCPLDAVDDSDGDGSCDTDDLCPGHPDDEDSDGDGVPDGCDVCYGGPDDGPDSDGDGTPDACDLCGGAPDGGDADGDGVPDGCEEQEPNDTYATANGAYAMFGLLSGELEGDQQDWFLLDFNTPGWFVMATSESAGDCPSIDTWMELWTGDGLAMLAEDDDSGLDACAALYVEVTAPTTYALMIRGFDSSESGSWTLTVRPLLPDTGAESEPNDAITNADGPLVPGVGVFGMIEVADQDVWRVDVETAGTLIEVEVSNTFEGCSFDAYLELIEPDGVGGVTVLAEDDNSGQRRCPALQVVLDAGTYGLRVRGLTSTDVGFYTLDLSTEVLEGFALEPDDTPAEAHGPIEGSEVWVGELEPSDLDLFQIDVTEPALFLLETSDTVGGCAVDTLLEVGTDDGAGGIDVAFSDEDGGFGDCSKLEVVLTPGTWFVRVSGETGFELGSYQLAMTRYAGIGEVELNDELATANGPYTGDVDLFGDSFGGDEDFFAIEVLADGTLVSFETSNSFGDCSFDSELEIGSDDGLGGFEVLVEEDWGGVGSCAQTEMLLDAGTWYVKVKPHITFWEGVYVLQVRMQTEGAESEPNGSPATAAELLDDERAFGEITSADEDYHRFEVAEDNSLVVVETSNLSGRCSMDTYVEVGSDDGAGGLTVEAEDAGSGASFCGRVTATLDAGTWYARITGQVGRVGFYTVVARIYPPVVDSSEPDDDLPNALGPITADGAWEGSITPGDRDMYRLDLEAPTEVHVEVTDGLGECSVDSLLSIGQDDGSGVLEPVHVVEGGGTGACSETTVSLDAGTWYLAVEGDGALVEGDYLLLIDLLP